MSLNPIVACAAALGAQPARPCDRGGERGEPAHYLGGILSAPSSRIVSPLSISFSTMWSASAANSSGRPSRDGNGIAAPSAGGSPRAARRAAACRRCRGRSWTQDAGHREVASSRQRYPDDAPFEAEQGDLADSGPSNAAIEAGVDAHAALARVAERLLVDHCGGRHPEGTSNCPDQIGLVDDLSRTARAYAPWRRPAIRSAQFRSSRADTHADPAGKRGRGVDRLLTVVESVTSISIEAACAAELFGERSLRGPR